MIKIGTDFSGIGSPEQALINLGIKHKSMFACDIDKYAKQSYLANYKTEHFYDDITKRNHNKTPYVDLYVAGFPCQAFSLAGKREGLKDTRGTLFFDLLKYLKAKKPKYFILENVKGLLSDNGGRTFLTILDCLAKTVNRQYSLTNYEDSLNYYVYYKVLNTKNYGIPQNRERVFIVGFRDKKHSFKFPKKIPLKTKLKDLLQDNVDNKYFLSDKTIKGIEKSNFRERQPVNINTVCRTLKTGGDPPCFKVHSLYPRSGNPKKGGTGHLSKEDGTTYCLDTGNNQAIEYEKKLRKLTPTECFRLQGFPDSFVEKCREIKISDTQLYKQAGNSITVNVMQHLIKEILTD
jgi:DNA (cytosine-5)-methyltransferase 1|tara:strand:- start:223 stop:1266 length:1044 start_codon:yes stop_codon:yes gene_type:complete